jgi:hypothetical protein
VALSLKHAFQSALPDSGDVALVQPSNWNAEHDMTTDTGTLVGDADDKGNVGSVAVGSGLALSGGTLTATGGGGGLPLQLPIQDGRYYIGPTEQYSGLSDVIDEINDRMIAIPFIFGEAKTWTRIGTEVISSGADDVARLGVFSDSNGLPGDLIVDGGEISCASTGFVEATISEALAVGTWYWKVIIGDSVTGTTELGFTAVTPISQFISGLVDAGGSLSPRPCYYKNTTYGPLPSSFGTPDGTIAVPPLIWLRAGV